MTPWHRLLGLVMTDFFSGSPFRVTMEKDLSERQKFLDILLIEGESTAWQPELCLDGLEPGSLRRHNYEMKWGTRSIRVIVCRRVELAERNALWLLFSGQEECVAFAMKHFGLNNHDMSTILSRISETYQLQGRWKSGFSGSKPAVSQKP